MQPRYIYPQSTLLFSYHHFCSLFHFSQPILQVLVGAQITCDEQDDDRDWRLVMQLLQILGRQHVMGKLCCIENESGNLEMLYFCWGMTVSPVCRGIAIGNELELLQFKKNISTDCIHRMWKGGYFFRKLSERAADLDGLEPSTRRDHCRGRVADGCVESLRVALDFLAVSRPSTSCLALWWEARTQLDLALHM